MQKSVLRILLISLTLIWTGCGVYQPENAELTTTTISEYSNPYFSDTTKDYVYKANMEIYGRNLGGIVVIKKINEDTHRVVFATDFGNKLLDFEISSDSFKVNFFVDGMDNKRFLKALEDDFRMLLQPVYAIDKTFVGKNEIIYGSEQNGGNIYLFENKEDKFLYKMIFARKSKEKITFEFQNKKDTFVEHIGIIHHNMPFTIQLIKI